MTTYGNLFFWGILALVALMAVMALIMEWWIYALIAVLVGGCFAATGPFILGRRWRPPPPRPTRRPVVRRRR
jgi:hypothetical protein